MASMADLTSSLLAATGGASPSPPEPDISAGVSRPKDMLARTVGLEGAASSLGIQVPGSTVISSDSPNMTTGLISESAFDRSRRPSKGRRLPPRVVPPTLPRELPLDHHKGGDATHEPAHRSPDSAPASTDLTAWYDFTNSMTAKDTQPQGLLTMHGISCEVTRTQDCGQCLKMASKETIPILTNINGVAMPGTVLAIMGPSGGGKTSLLDIIAGRKNTGTTSGKIAIGGKVVDAAARRIMCAYVTQDDVLQGTLTVRESLLFAASLKLPSSVSQEEKEARVQRLLSTLNLTQAADVRIGGEMTRGISGGQRRRVMMALELLTDSRILLLDEPTSGLDSNSALVVFQVLQQLARESHTTIICTVHQPRSAIFARIDRIMLLSAGCVAFIGARAEAASFFEKAGNRCLPRWNPADFLLDCVSSADAQPQFGQALGRKFISSPEGAQTFDILKSVRGTLVQTRSLTRKVREFPVGFLAQTWALVARNLLSMSRNPQVLGQLFGGYIGAAVFLSLLFFAVEENVEQSLLLELTFSQFVHGIFAFFSVPAFLSQRLLFTRERAAGYYTTGATYMATCIVSTVNTSIAVCVYVAVLWGIQSQGKAPFEGDFVYLLVINLLLCQAMFSFCEMIGCVCDSLEQALIGGTAGLVVVFIFSGTVAYYNNIPGYVKFLFWSNPFSYGINAVICNELLPRDNGLDITPDPDNGFIIPNPAGFLLEAFGSPIRALSTVDDSCIGADCMDYRVCWVIGSFWLAFRVLGYFALRLFANEKR